MTIADTLSDAAAEIERYLADRPEACANVRAEIEALLSGMQALRIRLDTLPARGASARLQ
jgi:hypothetical protein